MVNKIKIEKFTRNNSFNLWHIKIQALLKEEGIGAPLSDQPLKIDKLVLELQEEKVHFLILLSLSNEVLYEASKELTIVGLWLKLEKLFVAKSICKKFLLKQCLFGLWIRERMPLKEHLDELNSALMELHGIDVKMEYKDLEMIMLASLPRSYENFEFS